MFKVSSVISATRSDGTVSSVHLPDFWVSAFSHSGAADIAERIVFADRRTPDGALFHLVGVTEIDGNTCSSDYRTVPK